MTTSAYSVSAAFLGEMGESFLTLHFAPTGDPKAHIVYLPPFGEEMNRCRALAAEQARQFASSGYSCTIIDFYGTGDSEGELHQASFAIWRDNIQRVIAEYGGPDVPLCLWGMRLGALVALDYIAGSEQAVTELILWQPVTSGKRFVTQMLRQRVASLAGRGLPPETTKEIRQRIAEGENIEISGYTVGEALISDMEGADLAGAGTLCSGPLCSGTIHWLENINEPGQSVSTASRKAIDSLESQGNRVNVGLFADPPMWQLQERDSAPELLAITGGLLT